MGPNQEGIYGPPIEAEITERGLIKKGDKHDTTTISSISLLSYVGLTAADDDANNAKDSKIGRPLPARTTSPPQSMTRVGTIDTARRSRVSSAARQPVSKMRTTVSSSWPLRTTPCSPLLRRKKRRPHQPTRSPRSRCPHGNS